MPDEIREAIRKARGEGPNRLQDEEYRKRLQDKFGSRWMTKQLVQAEARDDKDTKSATQTEEEAAGGLERERSGVRTARRKRQRRVHVIRLRASAGGSGQGVERNVAVDVPMFRYSWKRRI